MENVKKGLTNIGKFRIIYFLFFFGDALFTAFISLYLVSIDLNALEKGIVLGLVPIGLFLGNLFYSRFAKSYKDNIRLLKIISLIEGLLILFFGFIKNFYVICVFAFLINFNNSSYFQIQDATLSMSLKKHMANYSTVRIFGSLAYLVALLCNSVVFKYINYQILFLISGCCMFLAFAFLFFLDKDYYDEKRDEQEETKEEIKEEKRSLFRNRAFIFVLLFNLLTIGSYNVNSYYYPMYLNSLGILDTTYSLFTGLGVGVETIALFLCTFIFKKSKSYKLPLLLGGLFRVIFCLCVTFIKDPNVLIAVGMVFNGIGTGLTLYGNVQFVHELFGDKKITKALTFIGGFLYLNVAIGNFVLPYIMDRISYPYIAFTLSCLEILGLVALLFAKNKKVEKQETKNV